MTYITRQNNHISLDSKQIAYREMGQANGGLPLFMLTHLAATLDNWDPLLVDLLAEKQHVILLDLPGVGASQGKVPDTIADMAQQAIDIITRLGYKKINLLGLSMGGMVAQEIVRSKADLVAHLILAGTGPRGGFEVDKVTGKTFRYMVRASLERVDPKRYIFYGHDEAGSVVAEQVLSRMTVRQKKHMDTAMKMPSFLRQLRAIKRWGQESEDDLSYITMPTLIVNGEQDMQVPTENSYIMHDKIKNSKLIIYQNAGHGSIFQYAEEFSQELLAFLERSSNEICKRSEPIIRRQCAHPSLL